MYEKGHAATNGKQLYSTRNKIRNFLIIPCSLLLLIWCSYKEIYDSR